MNFCLYGEVVMKLIVLAGGGGTRLFPLSRARHPKQFLKLTGKSSLLQQTINRFLGLVMPKDIVVVTNEDYIFHVKSDLKEIGAEDAAVICEPSARNTAPAIALAVSYCRDELQCNEDEVVVVTPADHMIRPELAFRELIDGVIGLCYGCDAIITMGVVPTRAETGYGYIQAGDYFDDTPLMKVKSFKEKPNAELAEQYLKDKAYFWNSGMFIFSIGTFLRELKVTAPDIYRCMGISYTECINSFLDMPNISVDYAIAEKSNKMAIISMDKILWSDIGSFDAIAEIMSNEDGNAFSGDVIAENCNNTMILGQNRLISAIGVDDMLIVDTEDALLVSKKGCSQDVRKIVNKLKIGNRREADLSTTVYTPWGKYTVLAEGDGYRVQMLTINPGDMISLQLHYHRSEHWTVISGTGQLFLGEKVSVFKENESAYIPIATKHRLCNPGRIPLSIIQVQNGKYLHDDDIVRFEDKYGRV